jgi:activating signal cointegrator 1
MHNWAENIPQENTNPAPQRDWTPAQVLDRLTDGHPVTIKCLSLTQPWASLVAVGAKRYETRSWRRTWVSHPIAIHAAKALPRECEDLAWHNPFRAALQAGGYVGEHGEINVLALERGTIIAVGWLVACHRAEAIRDSLSVQERAFGDFSDGRWAWELADVRRLADPIHVRGALGLWEWSGVLGPTVKKEDM